MVKQEYNLRSGGHLYEEPGEGFGEYSAVEGTGAGAGTVFIDNSQNITNYIVNVEVTGQELPKLHTGGGPGSVSYIFESQKANELLLVLDEIEEARGDPADFEVKLCKFLTVLEDLTGREDHREIYFSDLVFLLRAALVNIECSDFTNENMCGLKEAVNCIGHPVTQEKLQEIRRRFRETGIDILRPFTANVDLPSVLKEMYPDEATT